MSDLIRYDAMCQAIAECYQVDEIKNIRDKAMAMEAYAKQALNTDSERKAKEIRIRAERKVGLMMSDMGKTAPKDRNPEKRVSVHGEPIPSEFAQAKESANISDSQAKRWQNLAKVSDGDFEEALNSPAMPSTTSILAAHKKPNVTPNQPIDHRSLRLVQWAEDFTNEQAFKVDAKFLVNQMTPSMIERLKRDITLMQNYLLNLGEII